VKLAGKRILPRGALLVWVALGLAFLTFCGGKTDDPGSGGGGTSTGGLAGHTAACTRCDQGSCGYLCPIESGGSGGLGGLGGFAGYGGPSSFGGAGHTAFCSEAPFPCGGQCFCRSDCPCSPSCPCVDASGTSNDARDSALSEATVVVRDALSEVSPDDAPLMSETSTMTMAAARPVALPSCYVLAGYEPDPCLSADDALLFWLSNVPTACKAHITAGPFVGADSQGRTCCYSVACE